MIKFYKILFFNTLIMSTMITISSYSWFTMWMGLEINLLSIIPLFSSTKNMLTSESTLKYFLTQAIASLILLFSVILMLSFKEFIVPQMNSFSMMLNSALMIKMGAAPFHFWFPEVMEGLSWSNCMILLTWQKIAPMILLMNNYINMKFILFVIFSSLLISTLMSFNQISLRKILSFSSINHIAWMLSSMLISFSIWLIYFIIYSLISINLIILFKLSNSFYIKQLINSMNSNNLLKFLLMMNFLSLGGLPPFIGFIPKWLTINWLIDNNFYFLTTILIVMTLIMLFVYIRISFSTLILISSESKIKITFSNNFLLLSLNFISLMSMFIISFMFNFL